MLSVKFFKMESANGLLDFLHSFCLYHYHIETIICFALSKQVVRRKIQNFKFRDRPVYNLGYMLNKESEHFVMQLINAI